MLPMKIGLLWPDYWPYIRRGTERMVHDISTFLERSGHEVHIATSKPGPPSYERDGDVIVHRLRQLDHPLLRYYSSRLGRLTYRFDMHSLAVLPLLLRERFDLIHSFIY